MTTPNPPLPPDPDPAAPHGADHFGDLGDAPDAPVAADAKLVRLRDGGEWLDAAATAALFAERAARVDWAAFDALLARDGGEPPGPEDR